MKQIRRHLTTLLVLSFLASIGVFFVVAGTLGTLLSQPAALSVSYAQPPVVSATAVLVIDEGSGTVFYSKQPDQVLPIASVTKLFAAAQFFKRVDPGAVATITWSDVYEDGRAGRLIAGQQYTNHNLLFPALLESSNDAAAAMARIDPGLVGAMNEFASSSGVTHTHFVDTSGLSDENVSTAHELAVLFGNVIKTEPHIIDITTLPNYLNHINAWLNNNPFIADERYRGGKHGFTYAANRTAVARFAEHFTAGERVVMYVILGSDNLAADMSILREFVRTSVSYR